MSKQSEQSDLSVFCANVAYLRKSRNLTKQQMCRLMHVTPVTLNLLERGIVPPRLSSETIFFLTDAFDLTFSQLFRPRK